MKKNLLLGLLTSILLPAALCAADKYVSPQTKKEMTVVAYPEDLGAASENFLGENRIAWRGERVIVRFVANSVPEKAKISAQLVPAGSPDKVESAIPARAEYVRATHGQNGESVLDIVEPAGTPFQIPAGDALFLVSCDIPTDAALGEYELRVEIGSETSTVANVEVLPLVLPPPKDWRVYLDLWQHPEAVARWAGTPLWSKKHFAAMKPIMLRLAEAGQKTITCSIVEEPWKHQTFDDWTSMVKWTKNPNGSWKFDYTAFDAYVEFMMNEVGITEQISCYTMVPWSNQTKYFDKATKEMKTISIDPSDPETEPIWRAFLTDFRNHVKQKGWLEKTCIGLDERPNKLLRAARELIQRYAPELKIVSAVNFPAAPAGTLEDTAVYALSPIFGFAKPQVVSDRKKLATPTKTAFYVCLNPAHPNTFPHSPAAEPHWLGFFAAGNGYDGFLRWAYNSWVDNPFENCVWEKKKWPAGETFLVYPGNRTTLRFETLRDGIEDFEKIAILREKAADPAAPTKFKSAVAELDKYLATEFNIKAGSSGKNDHAGQVQKARELLDTASKLADVE